MKTLLIVLGFICVAIGAIGIVVPILPTTPFLLLASFFFAKGSKKFHDWFMSTKLYKKHLESFVNSRAMTLKSKLTILLPVSCMLIATFIFVNNLKEKDLTLCEEFERNFLTFVYILYNRYSFEIVCEESAKYGLLYRRGYQNHSEIEEKA